MSDIAPISQASAPDLIRRNRAQQTKPADQTPARGRDQVELSAAARLLGRLHELPLVRQDLVDSVRTQIAQGTYETPDKIDSLLSNLAQDLID